MPESVSQQVNDRASMLAEKRTLLHHRTNEVIVSQQQLCFSCFLQVLCVLFSAVHTTAGGYISIIYRHYEAFTGKFPSEISFYLLRMGGCLCALTFLGWILMLCFHRTRRKLYWKLVMLIPLVVVFCGILLSASLGANALSYSWAKETRRDIEKRAKYNMQHYSDPDTKGSVDLLQHLLQCCGTNGPMSWHDSTSWALNESYTVPDSCCAETWNTCGWRALRPDLRKAVDIHRDGCIEKVISWAVSTSWSYGILLVVFTIVQMIFLCGYLCAMGVMKQPTTVVLFHEDKQTTPR